MSENVNFIQGRKEQYNPSEMQGGLFFSKDSKEILLNGESYGNATPADEEDITAESGNLKLKDRAYDEANFSGKGYKILRKNIVEGKNILTQDMINEPNTIYEIRYDFDLNEATINIPEGCVLKFDGGTVNNGMIRSNKTAIMGIPQGLNIIGKIYNINGEEITIRGDVINRNYLLLYPIEINNQLNNGIFSTMLYARNIGITDCIITIPIDINFQTGECTINSANAQPVEHFLEIVSNNNLSVYALKFHSNQDSQQDPDTYMQNYIDTIYNFCLRTKDSIQFQSVYISNEHADWTKKGSKHIQYLNQLSLKLIDLGLNVKISDNDMCRNFDRKNLTNIHPDLNFYPVISFMDENATRNQDLVIWLCDQIVQVQNLLQTNDLGLSESGVTKSKKGLRNPPAWDFDKLEPTDSTIE